MKINKNNYEIFVIDFLEGNLSKEQMRMFQLFLNENPDINEEIIDLNEATLPLEEMIFNDKDILKKDTIRELDKIDFLLAKKLEGDLNSEEDKFVEKLLASDESIRKSWSLMKKITLSPEVFTENFKSLKFPDSINYTVCNCSCPSLNSYLSFQFFKPFNNLFFFQSQNFSSPK